MTERYGVLLCKQTARNFCIFLKKYGFSQPEIEEVRESEILTEVNSLLLN